MFPKDADLLAPPPALGAEVSREKSDLGEKNSKKKSSNRSRSDVADGSRKALHPDICFSMFYIHDQFPAAIK